MFDAPLLVGWFLAVAVLGAITNFALVDRLFRETKCRGSGIAVGVFACFAVHLPSTWVLSEFVIQIWRVPLQGVETVGYYVGPAVLGFVSLPVGVIACRCWSRRGLVTQQEKQSPNHGMNESGG
jgi:hypothetical protein